MPRGVCIAGGSAKSSCLKTPAGREGKVTKGAFWVYLSTADEDQRPISWMRWMGTCADASIMAPETRREWPPNLGTFLPSSVSMCTWIPTCWRSPRSAVTKATLVITPPCWSGTRGVDDLCPLLGPEFSRTKWRSEACQGHSLCTAIRHGHRSERLVRLPLVEVLWIGMSSRTSSPSSVRWCLNALATSNSRSMNQLAIIHASARCACLVQSNGSWSSTSTAAANAKTSKPSLRREGPRPRRIDRTASRIVARISGWIGSLMYLIWWLIAACMYSDALLYPPAFRDAAQHLTDSMLRGNGATSHAAQIARKVLSLDSCAGCDVLARMSRSSASSDLFRLFGCAATNARVSDALWPLGCCTGRSALPRAMGGLSPCRPASSLLTSDSAMPCCTNAGAMTRISCRLRTPCRTRSTANSWRFLWRRKSHNEERSFFSIWLSRQVLW